MLTITPTMAQFLCASGSSNHDMHRNFVFASKQDLLVTHGNACTNG